MLSTDANKAYADPLRSWTTEKGYIWDEIHDASNLRGTLLKYDLVILAPELDLPDKWVRNFASFVKNSQSLLVIDKIAASDEQKMAWVLGYDGLRFERFHSEDGQLKMLDTYRSLGVEFVHGENLELQDFQGNKFVSGIMTGKPLAQLTYTGESGNSAQTVAIVSNIYGRGRVLHLNFRLENIPSQLNGVLENIFNWLLCTDVLPSDDETELK